MIRCHWIESAAVRNFYSLKQLQAAGCLQIGSGTFADVTAVVQHYAALCVLWSEAEHSQTISCCEVEKHMPTCHCRDKHGCFAL